MAYLELHIEQGPVLEREGRAVAAVTGTAGVERVRLRFTGQAAHAGTTPMDMRRDAGLAAAATALAVEDGSRAARRGGHHRQRRLDPGIVTAVAGVGRDRRGPAPPRARAAGGDAGGGA